MRRERELCILINAYNYPDKATDLLIKSINNNLKILIVSYGKNTRFQQIDDNIYNLQVIHNSIDYTALIAVVEHRDLLIENDIIHNCWFYIHNTTKFGKSFKPSMLRNKTCRLTNYPSMNMGTYLHKDLLRCTDILLDKKSSDHPSKTEIIELKRNAIKTEDSIFKHLSKYKKIGIYCGGKITIPEKLIYSNNILRITEYYKKLDFYKYKANWGQRNNDPIIDL